MINLYKMNNKDLIKTIVLSGLLLALSPQIASGEFRLCNDTQAAVTVAIGYYNNTDWVTKGWWRVTPLNCMPLIKEPLNSRFYYIHAEDAKADGRWEGPILLCVKEQKFNITGLQNCYVRGFQKAGFQEVDTRSQANWTVHLKDNKVN